MPSFHHSVLPVGAAGLCLTLAAVAGAQTAAPAVTASASPEVAPRR
jgi:hypothetical protein